jgi:GTP pyrophosphokinase
MDTIEKYSASLQKEVLDQYRELIRICLNEYDKRSLSLIKRSFVFLMEHTDENQQFNGIHLVRFAAGLALIALKELGMDAIGVSSALLLHCVKQNQVPTEKVTSDVSERTATVIEEYLKISDLDTTASHGQAENMRNLILTLATDFRVILVKIAERLYLMRQMVLLHEKEQIELSCESRFIYSPLAHRLGLYNVMSEMEDISMSVLEKEEYNSIAEKLKASTQKRDRFIKEFIQPLQEDLEREKFHAEIRGRPKAISSIWRKMKKQKVEFEEVYDKFAIRIIIDTTLKREKADCWKAYSIITDHYQPNPERLRDWKWVEVQIRTKRMNEIAEKGLAAHWKYKGIKGQAGIDKWIERVRETLENAEMDASNLMEDLKLSQYSKEIFVFTPNGDLKKFPENATVLDFAFDIHTDVGASCVGARVNGKNVPIRYQLKNGDKVEILRSKTQKPKMDWLNAVVTSKARGKIKQALKEAKLKEAEHGKETLKRRFRNWKIDFNDSSIRKVIQHFKYRDATDLYFDVATEKMELLQIKELLTSEKKYLIPNPRG